MILWIDAQLPPSLAPWLTETFGIQAQLMRFLGLRDAGDVQIFEAARQVNDAVIMSKDSDFVEMMLNRGAPPRLIWVTCGNLTNRRLRYILTRVFPDALHLLQTGELIVEIGDIDQS